MSEDVADVHVAAGEDHQNALTFDIDLTGDEGGKSENAGGLATDLEALPGEESFGDEFGVGDGEDVGDVLADEGEGEGAEAGGAGTVGNGGRIVEGG